MWSTVIRAYRVKTVSSYCETIPMWTSNYYDGISASSSSPWWGLIVKLFYKRRGTEGSELLDDCKLSTKCHHRKNTFISSQCGTITPPLLSFLFLLPPAAFNSSRHTVELHQKPYRTFPGRCIKTFLSVHCDLLGCLPQWVSVLFRMRQLHVALFCWALKKCLCDCGFMCVCAALHYCRFWPTTCCFVWDVAFSHCGVCFSMSIVIRPICHCIKELKSGRTLPEPDKAFMNSEP